MIEKQRDRKKFLLLTTVLVVSVSGLAYELVAGTMATYLLGQSITQFSFATGWFLASMGMGSYFTRFVKLNILPTLIVVQVVLSLVGGYSAFFMFFAFAMTETLYPVFMGLALIIGAGVGFEIPIILRLVGKYRILSLAISEVFTFDYAGALVASVLFPLILLPYFGLVRSSLFFGAMNLVAAYLLYRISEEDKKPYHATIIIIAAVTLILGFIFSPKLTRWIEDSLYQDPIVLTKDTRYQRIVITKWKDDVRLFLDGNLQFSTRDEARYHESLIHIPVLFLKKEPEKILVIGGGDGLAIREILKYKSIKEITLVELDPEMIRLFKENPNLTKINENALNSNRLKPIILEDAFNWLKDSSNKEKFDIIYTDLPDPNSYSLGKLYTVTFYTYILRHLEQDGIFVTQSTSPTFAPDAYWCIKNTIEFSGEKMGGAWKVIPYHTYIPSFGDWGFLMAGQNLNVSEKSPLKIETSYLSDEIVPTLFAFSKDIIKPDLPVNHLDNQVLVDLYAKSWHKWYQ